MSSSSSSSSFLININLAKGGQYLVESTSITKNISTCTFLLKKKKHLIQMFVLFVCVCVEVLRPSQPNGVMLSAVSLPYHTFTGQAFSPLSG